MRLVSSCIGQSAARSFHFGSAVHDKHVRGTKAKTTVQLSKGKGIRRLH